MIETTNNVRNAQTSNQQDAVQQQGQNAQQTQATAKKKSRFAGLFHSDKRAAAKDRREQVRDYVQNGGPSGTLASLAAPKSSEKGTSNTPNALHDVAHDVIKYSHTGLHAHAVKGEQVCNALAAVKEMIGLIAGQQSAQSADKNRKLAHDQKRLTRHEKHLTAKAEKANTCGVPAKGEILDQKAPATEKAPAKGVCDSSSSCDAKEPAKAPEKAPAKAAVCESSSSCDAKAPAKAPEEAPAKAACDSSSSCDGKAPAKGPTKGDVADAKGEEAQVAGEEAQAKGEEAQAKGEEAQVAGEEAQAKGEEAQAKGEEAQVKGDEADSI